MRRTIIHAQGRRQRARRFALLSASSAALAVACAGTAHAQSAAGDGAAASDSSQADDAKAIVVTGSRIKSAGFDEPTPTTVIGSDAIATNAEPNVFTTVAQLPSMQGSTGVTVGTNSTSSGQQGLSSFSLHGVGTGRTLTLLDGQRVVGANVTGVPDISLFPQILIQRVDVVTGGASASYGSDAIGGVVNFITEKHFEGLKANFETGLSTYGDNAQAVAQIAVGHAFLDDRLHIEVTGEYVHEDGVGAGGFGEEGPAGRDWYRTSTLVATPNQAGGTPHYLYFDHAQAYAYAKYGIINAGPLQGTAFDASGQPYAFQYGGDGYGHQGVPNKDAGGTMSNCYGAFCIGGDLSGNVGIGTTLQSSVDRYNSYSRIGFDFADNNEIYATFNIAKVDTSNQPNPGAAQSSLTIQCSNPYVPQLVQDACATNGITQFRYGVSNAILPNILVSPSRKQYRGVIGIDGVFDLGGTDWSYDGYFEHGENVTDITVSNMMLKPHYFAAIQAVELNGQIVCADPVARANGCVPINIFGDVTPSQAALDYIQPRNGPYQHTLQTQNVASFNISGDPVQGWAGPISVAAGFEYRREFYRVTGDPYGNGVTADDPLTDEYPADPLVSPGGANWYAGNYTNGSGKYHVAEGYLELNVPLVDSAALGKANLNIGGRLMDYSTAGTETAWKIGGSWALPIDGLRFRAVTSRDVRAPNLSDLYAAPTLINFPTFPDLRAGHAGEAVQLTLRILGNPALKPEIGRNTTFGLVLSQPSWAPGLSLSVDYFSIKIKDVIGSLGTSQVIRFCEDGTLDTCDDFYLDDPTGQNNFINLRPYNLASLLRTGIDFEASYQTSAPLGLPGRLTLRALATRNIHAQTDQGLPGSVPSEAVGVNAGSAPTWKVTANQSWSTDNWHLTVQERWFSDGVFSNDYVVCQTDCPAVADLPTNGDTVNFNSMPGALYVDLSGGYKLTEKAELYFKIDNLFNRDPTPAPSTSTGIDINPGLYDTIGRMYRVGIHYNF